MQHLNVEHGDRLAYRYQPADGRRHTFVTFNALTQSMGAWDAVAAHWQEHGHGVLRFDMRGQGASTAAPGVRLDVSRIAADASALLAHVKPPSPILVGLSIGGLFAARTVLAGAQPSAMVLINTLRRPGLRLEWINQAVLRAMNMGGPELVRDMFAPLLMSESTLEAMRADAFPSRPYTPLDPGEPLARLVEDCVDADWDVPYESLKLPVLVVTGLLDRVFLELKVLNALTLRLPDPHRVDFDDAGHLVPSELPRRLADAVTDFASTL